ncbi:MAG: hypothetical protein ACLQHL_12525 [Candidatus Cybelea sp.]
MFDVRFGRYALGVCAACAILAGCGEQAANRALPSAGGVSNAPVASAVRAMPSQVNPLVRSLPGFAAREALNNRATRAGSWESPGGGKQAVYAADPSLNGYYGAICYYATSGGSQLGCLAGGASSNSGIDFPQGTWIDKHKHLFVANGGPDASGYSGAVTEYTLPLTTTSQPINALYSNLTNRSEGAMLGYVCGDKVGNIYGTTIYTDVIDIWKAGTKNTTETSTLTDTNFGSAGSPSLADGPVACAVDSAGDIFVSGQIASGTTGSFTYYAELDEFVKGVSGSGSAKVLQKETSDLYFPAGVAIDKKGELAWALFDLSDSGSSVCTFAKPYTGSANACTTGFATGFHFMKNGKALWGGDSTVYPWYEQPQTHEANKIAYPGGGTITSTSGGELITPVDASVNPPLK